jgi:hypothetical protein
MDLCSGIGMLVAVIGGLVLLSKGIEAALDARERKKAEALAAQKAREEAEFQQNHPELWRQRELLKLEKERMAAQNKLAEDRPKQEATTRKVGLVVGIGRALGWW